LFLQSLLEKLLDLVLITEVLLLLKVLLPLPIALREEIVDDEGHIRQDEDSDTSDDGPSHEELHFDVVKEIRKEDIVIRHDQVDTFTEQLHLVLECILEGLEVSQVDDEES